MFEFDPRDYDSRDDDRRDTRGYDVRDRHEDRSDPGHRSDLGDSRDRWDDNRDLRDDDGRDRRRDEDSLVLGRGPSSNRDEQSGSDARDRDDERWPERGRDPRDPPRDVFMRDLDLPRGRERVIVHDPREREYTLRGSETRTLSTVGAFRVVPARELRDHFNRPADPRDGDLRHLREQGLIHTVRLDGRCDVAVAGTSSKPIEVATKTRARSSTPASNASGSLNMTRKFIRRT